MLISNYITKQKSLIQMYLISFLSSFFTPLVRSQDFLLQSPPGVTADISLVTLEKGLLYS